MENKKSFNKVKILIGAVFITGLLFFLGCQNENQVIDNIILSDYKIDTSKENIVSYLALLDDSFIYSTAYMDTKMTTYYRHYLNSNKIIEIGSVENVVLETNLSAYFEGAFYFYETVKNNNELSNVVYSIDVKSNSLSMISEDKEYLPGAFIKQYDDIILTRQTLRKDNNDMITFVERNNPKTNKTISKSKNYYLEANNTGEYILNYSVFKDKIYLAINNKTAQNKKNPIIEVLDTNFTHLYNINMTAVKDYIMESALGKMQIWNDFIFMRNFSGNSLIGKIEDGNIKSLFQENDLDMSFDLSNQLSPVFYVRGTNKLIFPDETKGTIKTIKLDLSDYKGYTIKFVMSNDNNILITLYYDSTEPNDKKEDLIFCIPRQN